MKKLKPRVANKAVSRQLIENGGSLRGAYTEDQVIMTNVDRFTEFNTHIMLVADGIVRSRIVPFLGEA